MRLNELKNLRYTLPAALILILALFILLPYTTRPYIIIMLSNIFMYIVLTLSWAFFSGPTGYISLATAAFFGVGIYTTGLFDGVLPLPLLVLSGGVASFILAFFIGAITLRLRGIYFTVFTLGLVEFTRHMVNWWEINVVGSRGQFVTTVDNITVYLALLAVVVVLLLTTYLVKRSKYGLALASLGSSEEASVHIGVDIVKLKVFTFAVSAFFMGLTGTIMATRWSYFDATTAFDPFYSFLPPLMGIFGGLGNIFGPLVGASVFTYLEEELITSFPHTYMLIFGVVMVVTILYLPNGLVGLYQTIRSRITGGKNANAAS